MTLREQLHNAIVTNNQPVTAVLVGVEIWHELLRDWYTTVEYEKNILAMRIGNLPVYQVINMSPRAYKFITIISEAECERSLSILRAM